MATIQEELNYLEETKGLIKNAIINKGQDITDQDSFRSYVNKIDNISTVNLQSKTIDPTTNQQIIIPDQPNYNGLSSVTINAVTSNIDNNITVENIRSGVSILGVTGNYSGIDTSDATATADDIVTVMHLYHGEGYYTPKTAYVNGNKINGNIKETRSINGQIPENPIIAKVENISNISTWINHVTFKTTIQSNYSYVVNNTSLLNISVLNTALTNVFNITSDKLLNGYTLFGVTGNYSGIDTSDATALVNDIEEGKTAYVNGNKIMGTLNVFNYIATDVTNVGNIGPGSPMVPSLTIFNNNNYQGKGIVDQNTNISILVDYVSLASYLNVTPNIIKAGETILNVTGNYSGGMKEYANTTTMNNDISNISIDEVVKVLSGPNYFIKELVSNIPTMTELVKESETISPQEYEENIELVNDILGEEE